MTMSLLLYLPYICFPFNVTMSMKGLIPTNEKIKKYYILFEELMSSSSSNVTLLMFAIFKMSNIHNEIYITFEKVGSKPPDNVPRKCLEKNV